MRAWLLSLAAVLLPAVSSAGTTAGGLTLSTANLGQLGPIEAGAMPCIGGLGFRLDERRRLGGGGQICAAGGDRFAFGGVEIGRQRNVSLVYAGWGVGLGAGIAHAQDEDGRVRSGFVYARPGVHVGLPVGFGAIEGRLYAMVPVPLVQSLAGEAKPVMSYPSAGVEVSVLIGNFWDRKDRRPRPDDARALETAPASSPPPFLVLAPEEDHDDDERAGDDHDEDRDADDEIVEDRRDDVEEVDLGEPEEPEGGVIYEEDSRPLAIPADR